MEGLLWRVVRRLGRNVTKLWGRTFWPNYRYAEWYNRSRGAIIGQRCRLYTEKLGSEAYLVEIGDDVTVSFNVSFINHDAAPSIARSQPGGLFNVGRIRVGSRVFIGANTTILPGVSIGDDVILGAGSVVAKSIPSGVVAAGNPVRILCSIDVYRERVRVADLRDRLAVRDSTLTTRQSTTMRADAAGFRAGLEWPDSAKEMAAS